jgi:hypothetical protein
MVTVPGSGEIIEASPSSTYRHSPGRAYYDKKLAEGKTPKEALRCLKTPGPATHPTTPADTAADPLPVPFPLSCQPVRAGGRVQERAKPGRAAARRASLTRPPASR